MRKAVIAGGAVLILVGVMYALWPASLKDEENSASHAAGSSLTGIWRDADQGNTESFRTGLESLPASLKGTEVDGELEVDENGNLKITTGVRQVFDYFLATIGEEPLDTIVARIRAYIRHKLPPTAAMQAERLLDSYIGYKQGIKNIPQAPITTPDKIDIEAVRRQMQQVQALRSQFFTPDVIEAFFGDEDAYDRYTLSKLEISQNARLTPDQKIQQLATAEQQLPQNLRDSLKIINQYNDLESATHDWKKRGGNATELRQIRERIVGVEATNRLENLDREETAWDGRMNAWYSERDAILNNKSLSEQDRQQELSKARSGRFSEQERLRVETLERIRDRGEKVNPD